MYRIEHFFNNFGTALFESTKRVKLVLRSGQNSVLRMTKPDLKNKVKNKQKVEKTKRKKEKTWDIGALI